MRSNQVSLSIRGLMLIFGLTLIGWLPCLADTDQDLKDAYQLIRAGKYTDALAKYQAILTTNVTAATSDQKDQATYWSGIAYECLGQNDLAITSFEALVNNGASYKWAKALNKLAVRYRAKGNKAKSDAFIQQLMNRRASALTPSDQETADLCIGDCYKLKEDWTNALAHYQKIRPLYPDQDEEILFQIGVAAHAGKQYDTALQAFKEYADKYASQTHYEEVAFRTVEVYRDAKRYQEALDYLTKLMADHPSFKGRSLLAQAEIYAWGLKDTPTSMKLAQQIIDDKSSDPYIVYQAKYRLAVNYLHHLDQPDKARPILQEIVDQYPTDNLAVEIAYDLANTYYFQNDYLNAAKLYLQALDKYPCPVPEWEAVTLYMAGASYNDAKDKVNAKKAWDTLLAKHPESGWSKIAQQAQEEWTQ